MFSFTNIVYKVKVASVSTQVNIILPKIVTSSEPSAELANHIFEDNDLCVIDYKESDDSSENDIGAEMIRSYEEEERAWRVEQAERATRRMQQVEQAIKAHNSRAAVARRRAEAVASRGQVMETHRHRVTFPQGPILPKAFANWIVAGGLFL